MIEQLWSTPFLKCSMPEQVRENVINRIFTDYDLSKPPSDFGSVNIIMNESCEFQQFRNDVVYPAFNEFLQNTIGKTINQWGGHRLHGWLTGSGYDYSLGYHNHRGAQLSAVFYLLCEDRDSGGVITFTDPRQNANRGYDESFLPWFNDLRFTPKSGDIVVFPSFLYHFVSTYQGSMRLAIPIDLFLHTNK